VSRLWEHNISTHKNTHTTHILLTLPMNDNSYLEKHYSLIFIGIFGYWWMAMGKYVAEKEGFEPSVPCGTPDFESGTFDHSATSP
jgi:hypothetical protein